MLKNFNVYKIIEENNEGKMLKVPINWLRIAYPALEGFATFDAAGHR
jgi:hypothetical protein